MEFKGYGVAIFMTNGLEELDSIYVESIHIKTWYSMD